MENFNALKVYKFLLDFLWYTFIVICSIWMIVNIFSIAFNGVVKAGNLFTFRVKAPQSVNSNPFKLSETYNFSMDRPAEMEIQLDSFKVNQLHNPFILLYIFSFILAGLMMMFQVKLIRDFLRNIIAKKIFVKDNISKLKNIALIELLAIPLSIAYYVCLDTIFNDGSVLTSNFNFVIDYTDCFESIVRALEYFVFAGIFSFGYKLKQDQDLTI